MLSGVKYAPTGELCPSKGVPPGPKAFLDTPKSRGLHERKLVGIPADSSFTKLVCDSIHKTVVDADTHALRDGTPGHDR